MRLIDFSFFESGIKCNLLYRFVDRYARISSGFSACVKRAYLKVCLFAELWQNMRHRKYGTKSVVDCSATAVHYKWAMY